MKKKEYSAKIGAIKSGVVSIIALGVQVLVDTISNSNASPLDMTLKSLLTGLGYGILNYTKNRR